MLRVLFKIAWTIHDKIRKFHQISVNICFIALSEEFQKRVRISHGKRDIGVRVTEVLQQVAIKLIGNAFITSLIWF